MATAVKRGNTYTIFIDGITLKVLGPVTKTVEITYVQPPVSPTPPPKPPTREPTEMWIKSVTVSPKVVEPGQTLQIDVKVVWNAPLPSDGKLVVEYVLEAGGREASLGEDERVVNKGETSAEVTSIKTVPDLGLEPGKEYRAVLKVEAYLQW